MWTEAGKIKERRKSGRRELGKIVWVGGLLLYYPSSMHVSLILSFPQSPFLFFSTTWKRLYTWGVIATTAFRGSADAEPKQKYPRSSHYSPPSHCRQTHSLRLCVWIFLHDRLKCVCNSPHQTRLSTKHSVAFSCKHMCRHSSLHACALL